MQELEKKLIKMQRIPCLMYSQNKTIPYTYRKYKLFRFLFRKQIKYRDKTWIAKVPEVKNDGLGAQLYGVNDRGIKLFIHKLLV